ncbi:MAG: hypothetical protein JXA82_17815 [Sedimentisphaerales bacterium]|nr:hypothetical protein [Sedimentisphaerales bacterium]
MFKSILLISFGFILGCGTCLGLGYYLVQKGGGKPLVGRRTFGDIQIWAGTTAEVPGFEHLAQDGLREGLVLSRNEVPFFCICHYEDRNNDLAVLLNEKKKGILSFKPSDNDTGWEDLRYRGVDEKDVESILIDLDMNGFFDALLTMNYEEKVFDKCIRLDAQWQPVKRIDFENQIASEGDAIYTFESDQGWNISK